MHIRIEICKNVDDPSADLEIAASLRRDLWVHSPIEFDPLTSEVKTQRTEDRLAYFKFETDFPEEVDRVVREFGYTDFVKVVRSPANSQTSNT